jgi:septal ring factor EnvC (AmiA/AmiB activator)
MKRTVKYSRVLAALVLAVCGSAALAGDSPDSAEARDKLAALRARIQELTSRIGVELKQRDALSARLREAELDITAKRRRLDALRVQELAVERRRDELRAEQLRDQNVLASERAALAVQARSAYLIGRQERMRLLLNQENPAKAGRMLIYYGYFARARGAKIQEMAERVARIDELAAELEGTTTTLRTLQSDVAREMIALEHTRAERAADVAQLSAQVGSATLELTQLKREEQVVESLVADLSHVVQDFPSDSRQSFAELRGKLPWPVSGRLTARYQEPRAAAAQSSVRWNGVMIAAARGAKVRAPFFGRVLYADWLQGLGLLLIIGHSGNYMTLYGHAEVLYKMVGDWVAPGDVIAAMSDVGGAAPQLYFEIRDGRKPVDPSLWLKANPPR